MQNQLQSMTFMVMVGMSGEVPFSSSVFNYELDYIHWMPMYHLNVLHEHTLAL